MRRILEPNGSQPPIEAQSRINRFPPSSELSPSIAHTSEVAEFNRLSYSQLYSQDDSNLTIPSLLTMSTSMNLSPASSSSANIRGNGASILQSLNRNSISTNDDPNLYRSVSIHSPPPDISISRSRSRSRDDVSLSNPQISPLMKRGRANHQKGETGEKTLNDEIKRKVIFSEIGRKARKQNDSMVYLEGPRIYTCGECRTHLTSHDEIISKSFHGMHGRAYLFDQCVNIMTGPAEDRRLITGLHSVCDISCKRCKTVIGWTYSKAYEQSQKYKEGKFIIEKIYLHMEESDCYNIDLPAMEKRDRWRIRAMSWSSDHSMNSSPRSRDGSTVYEYRARSASFRSPKTRSSSISTAGVSSIGSPPLIPAFTRALSPPEL